MNSLGSRNDIEVNKARQNLPYKESVNMVMHFSLDMVTQIRFKSK